MRALYASWAADYDRDVFERMGGTGSRQIADLLADAFPDAPRETIDADAAKVMAFLAETGLVVPA